ncbi:MAG: hypothetical protein JXA93_20805 [Anaerolineae bacterium]|nr:hypothetical protein [Anaerolineae bacterium]
MSDNSPTGAMRQSGPVAGVRCENVETRQNIHLDVYVAALLLLVALAVRWAFCRAVGFPPLDDPAFYLVTAKNVVSGRGLVVDALWSYHTLFPLVTHPSHEHWMPVATWVNAAAFVVERLFAGELRASLDAAQVPGAILGALLAPLTYLVGRRHLPGRSACRWLAASAALLVGLNATLAYQNASADSGAPFALLAAAAIVVAAPPLTHPRALATGMLIALAYLARSDGLLLLAAVGLLWLVPLFRRAVSLQAPGARPRPAHLLLLLAGFGLVVAPWLVRNTLVFGTPLPGSLVSQAWLGDYAETFNYRAHPTLNTLLAQGLDSLLLHRWQALANNGRVFLLNTFAWGLLALPGLWLLRRRAAFALPAVYGLLLFFVTALLFPISATWGTFYHSFGALLPFLALAAAHALWQATGALGRAGGRLREVTVGAIVAGLLILAGAQVFLSIPAVGQRHDTEKAQFQAIARWLDDHAAPGDVIMTSQPYTLNLVSGHSAIVLPAAEPPDAAWAAAQRYHARYLVITQPFGLYPEVLHHQPDPRFRLVATLPATEIYEIDDAR